MILEEPGNDIPYAAFLVRRLMSLRANNPKQQIDDALGPLLPFTFASTSFSASGNDLGFYYGGNNGRRLFFIDGVRNNGQAAALVNGYGESATSGGFQGTNPYIVAQAQRVLSVMNNPAIQLPEHVDFIGYSAGGAVATMCKYILVFTQSLVKSKVVTFGAPRSINSSQSPRLANSPITRWMTPGDPIPLVPPRIADVPALAFFNGFLTNVRWGNYVHTAGGIVVDVNGNTGPSVLPPLAQINATTALVGWLLGEEDTPNNQHALTTYNAYLNRAEQVNVTPPSQHPDDGPRERPQETDRRRMTQQEQQTLTQIANASVQQNEGPLVVPPAVLFRAVRFGRTWAVVFGGEVVAVAPIRRRAQSIARSGNAFLRKLPRQAVVDVNQLSEQFNLFLADATNPAAGFVPQINTQI